MDESQEIKSLWESIAKKRFELNQTYTEDGFSSERVLALSQELDRLLDQFDKLMNNIT